MNIPTATALYLKKIDKWSILLCMFYHNKRMEAKQGHFREKKIKRIHHQKTCTSRNAKGTFENCMTPDRNADSWKRMKNIGSAKYFFFVLFSLSFFINNITT